MLWYVLLLNQSQSVLDMDGRVFDQQRRRLTEQTASQEFCSEDKTICYELEIK